MFRKLSDHPLPVLQAVLEQYQAEETGTRHLHLRTEADELAFLVGFPTVPQVGDGRAHILEHLALCGSERFPVADPFFSMMRRSLSVFMNAMTYADRTVYPFATTDRADYFNLMDVYLDATFFPRLDELSFRQEGWRYLADGGKLSLGGVVLNEMKGAYGNPTRVLVRGLDAHLFEGTTYAVDSGGDPLLIPELTHPTLLDFHASHYHPSQAFFLTAGRIPAEEIQARIAAQVLSRKPGKHPLRMPELAPAWHAPRFADVRVPSQKAGPEEFGVQLAWRMPGSRDAQCTARCQLFARGLLGDASAPVLKAMQSAGFGRPSQYNGVNTGARQLAFHLGMEGLGERQIDAARQVITRALQAAARDGVPTTVFQAAIRDMRFNQRQIRGGGMPDALSRLLEAVPALMYGAEVLPSFDNEEVLAVLEQEFADPEFFKGMVRELLENPTCLVARVIPDASYARDRDALEAERLRAKAASLGEAGLRRIQVEAEALVADRAEKARTDVLPRIAPVDVGREPRRVPAVLDAGAGAVAVEVASNGISYATLSVDLGGFDKKDWPWLALYVDLLPGLGARSMGFEEASAWRQQRVPAFGVYLEALVEDEGSDTLVPALCLFASGLSECHADIMAVVRAWADEPRFDELDRIAFLARSLVDELFAKLPENGGQLASWAAAAPLAGPKAFSNQTRGLVALPFWHSLKVQLESPEGLRAVAAKLGDLHEQLRVSPRRVTWVSSGPPADDVLGLLGTTGRVASPPRRPPGTEVSASCSPEPANLALVFSGQVNHCFMVWRAPGMTHMDAPGLAVAAELLTHRILHRRLREQGGAYGGSASYSGEDGLFTMSSYRDPRLAGTYADFSAGLEELLGSDYTQEALEEAIIGVIKRLDKPLSPYDQGMEAVRLRRRGVTFAHRKDFRQRVLSCTLEQVRRAAYLWLKQGQPSRTAAVTTADQDLAGLVPVDVLRSVG